MKLTKAQDRFIRSNPGAQRLFKRVTISENGCWTWGGAANEKGYGYMAFRGKTWKVHRASYSIFCGEIPDGLHVCHHCDNPSCVNPAHLFLGHAKTNMLDMVRKGRGKNCITSQQGHFKAGHAPRGERASSAKLARRAAEEILAKAAGGALTKDLMEEYGLARYAIQALLRGETWKDLKRPAGLPRRSGAYDRPAGRQALANSGGKT